MAAKITLNILGALLDCKLKAHLRVAGQQGIKSDYEATLGEAQHQVRRAAIEKIRSRYPNDAFSAGAVLNRLTLTAGAPFILDAELANERYAIRFDGLMKVDSASDLGDFHYVPVLFTATRQISKQHRRLLAALAVLLSRVQGKAPDRGVIYHGSGCAATIVRLGTELQAAADLLDEAARMQVVEAAPRLLLNDHCQVCEFRERCHSDAVQEDNLSLIRSLGEKEIKKYGRKGLFTLTQLAHAFRPRRKGKRPDRPGKQRYHALHAMAIRDNTVYVLGKPEVPSAPVRVYLDMEGNPDEGFVYLVGMIVCDGIHEDRLSFWADGKDRESDMFEQFLAAVGRYENVLIFTYGSYERAFIMRMRRHARRKKPVDKVLGALVNILSIVYAHFYFPTYSNGLKDIGGCLGCKWSEAAASGIQSIVWRMRWDRTRDDRWKTTLTEYNLEDCAALRRVTKFLRMASTEASAPLPHAPDGTSVPRVARARELDRLADNRKWRKIDFVHEDFDFVNRRAYFNYQRQRVFVRTSPTIKKHVQKPGYQRNHRLRVSERVKITASRCPACGARNVAAAREGRWSKDVDTRMKRAFDLVITPGGMRRRVIECTARTYRCETCNHHFIPERYERLAKHFHGLMSWAIYEQVAHRHSIRSLAEMFGELFGLTLSKGETYMFKPLMAAYYRSTYRRLLAKLVSGQVLHVDETDVTLKTGKGYVWVFASVEEVVYVYRPTREGEFLQGMLKDFNGVLISDFYAAYDSLACPQQKCLIHLLRDLNQEVLNNPFDEEVRSVTQSFGALLRSIVATIDEHGLKKRYLARHLGEVDEFFRGIWSRSFRSEAAQALQERLKRNRKKLFTFVGHSGVPWNNNAAENAIKRFAYYRAGKVSILTEAGLNDYLVLLSIYQTCRYKGISFLKFLLSKERDIDEFCAGKHKRWRRHAIELYPRRFIPPHLAGLRRTRPLPQAESADATTDPAC